MDSEPLENVSEPANKTETFVTYKGNPILNFEGAILFFYFTLFSFGGCLAIIQNQLGMAIFCVVFDAVLFIIGVKRLYYFSCSDTVFEVQNHLMFWAKKTYCLSDLNRVKFEMPYKMPGCVRLFTKDSENSRFPAGSLSDRQWIALKDRLEELNVPVLDEFIDGIVFYEFVLFDEIKEIFRRFKKNER